MNKLLFGFCVGIVLLMTITLTHLPNCEAADVPVSESLTFEWEQNAVDLPFLAGWTLYESNVSGSGYVKVTDIPYVAGDTTFQTTAVLNVIGAAGSTVNRYYVLTAKNIAGLESVYSNEATNAFEIPIPAVSKPFNLIIKVITK